MNNLAFLRFQASLPCYLCARKLTGTLQERIIALHRKYRAGQDFTSKQMYSTCAATDEALCFTTLDKTQLLTPIIKK